MAPLSFEFQTLLPPSLSPSHQEQPCLAAGLHSSVHPLLCWCGDLCKAWPCTWHPPKQEHEWLLRPSKRWLPSTLRCCFLPSLAMLVEPPSILSWAEAQFPEPAENVPLLLPCLEPSPPTSGYLHPATPLLDWSRSLPWTHAVVLAPTP